MLVVFDKRTIDGKAPVTIVFHIPEEKEELDMNAEHEGHLFLMVNTFTKAQIKRWKDYPKEMAIRGHVRRYRWMFPIIHWLVRKMEGAL